MGFEGLPIPSIEHDPQLDGDDFHRTYGIAALFFIYVGLIEQLIAKDAPQRSEKWRCGASRALCFHDCARGPPAAAISWAQ
jgi:hypothetical protein